MPINANQVIVRFEDDFPPADDLLVLIEQGESPSQPPVYSITGSPLEERDTVAGDLTFVGTSQITGAVVEDKDTVVGDLASIPVAEITGAVTERKDVVSGSGTVTETIVGSAALTERKDAVSGILAFTERTTWDIGDITERKDSVLGDLYTTWDVSIEGAVTNLSDTVAGQLIATPEYDITGAVTERRDVVAGNVSYAGIIFVQERMSFRDTPSLFDRILGIAERLAMLDTVTPRRISSCTVQEKFKLSERFRFIFQIAYQEVMEISDSQAVTLQALQELRDGLLFADTDTPLLTANVAVAAALTLADQQTLIKHLSYAEALKLADNAILNLLSYLSLLEGLSVGDTVTPTLTAIAPYQERMELGDTPTTLSTLIAQVSDAFTLGVLIQLGDEIYFGYALNTETGAVSRYEGIAFNSLCRLNGHYIGAGSDGLYQLGGTTDADTPIRWQVTTGLLDLKALSRVPDLYLVTTRQGETLLKVRTLNQDGTKTEYWYKPVEYQQGIKSGIGKGLTNQFWQFSLESVEPIDIQRMSIQPIVLKRRI